jgi:hypothetical protein
MPLAEYLRQQAATCQRLSRATFDLTTAERLRFLAAELWAKAEAVENEQGFHPHMAQGNGLAVSTGKSRRD